MGKLTLCVSTEILFEYREILANKTNAEVADSFISFLMASPYVENVEVYYHFGLINSDVSDNKFSDCAIAANAQYLVSNDKHFQILKKVDFPKVNLLTLAEFDAVKAGL